jgi:hypothetical protein
VDACGKSWVESGNIDAEAHKWRDLWEKALV